MNRPDAATVESLLAHLITPKTAETSSRSQPEPVEPPGTLADDPLMRVLGASNPLLEAARPLLRALTDIPELPLASVGPDRTSTGLRETPESEAERLCQALSRDLHTFHYLCERAGFRREQLVAARYCLCTALDEAVYKLPGMGGHWAAHSLLLLFHNETSGGEKFFLLLGHMVQSPQEHAHVLELLYHILSLGFEGRYALMVDGARQLETIHRRLLAVISEQSEPVLPELSAHWRGASGGKMRFMRTVPVWVTACVLVLLLMALHASFGNELAPKAAALAQRIEALSSLPPPPVPVWTDEWPLERWFTPDERKTFGLQVDTAAQSIIVPGSLAFVNGVELHRNMARVLDIVSARLKASGRQAQVVGHTDNTPLRTGSIFRDNRHLSEARAEAVVREMVRRGVDGGKLRAFGKSDTQPLADNATPEGRAQNRRVEIMLLPSEVKP